MGKCKGGDAGRTGQTAKAGNFECLHNGASCSMPSLGACKLRSRWFSVTVLLIVGLLGALLNWK